MSLSDILANGIAQAKLAAENLVGETPTTPDGPDNAGGFGEPGEFSGGPGAVLDEPTIPDDPTQPNVRSAINNSQLNFRITIAMTPPQGTNTTQGALSAIAGQAISFQLTGLVRNSDGTTEPIGPGGGGYTFAIPFGTPNGGVLYQLASKDFNLGTSRAVDIAAFNLALLVSNDSFGSAQWISRGRVFVIIQDFRFLPDGTVSVVSTRCADYITPGNPITNKTGVSDPTSGKGYMRWIPGYSSAGAGNLTIQPPPAINIVQPQMQMNGNTGLLWRIRRIFFNYATNGSAGARHVQLRHGVTPINTATLSFPMSNDVAGFGGGVAANFAFMLTGGPSNGNGIPPLNNAGAPDTIGVIHSSLPEEWYYRPATDTLGLYVTGADAGFGDLVTLWLMEVEEWISI